MAKRNIKAGHEGNRIMFWGVSIGTLVAVLAMVYLSLFNTCESIGREIKKLEHEKAEIHKRVVNEERNWATARSTPNMERLMAHHGIVMSWPEEQNIIRLHVEETDEPARYAFHETSTRRD